MNQTPEVPAGTRCECRSKGVLHRIDIHGMTHAPETTRAGRIGIDVGEPNESCARDAVRMVPVREGTSLDGTPMNGKRAMCAACAEYHESKVAK